MQPSRKLSKLFSIFLSLTFFLSSSLLPNLAEASIWAERRQNSSAENLVLAQLPSMNSTQISGGLQHGFSGVSQKQALSNLPERFQKSLKKSSSKNLDRIIQSIPENLGSLQNIHSNGPSKKVVVLLQDVHMNHEAQSNIGQMIEEMVKADAIDQLALEGADRTISVEDFRTYSDQDSVLAVAKLLFSKGAISGPIYQAIRSEKAFPAIVGVDHQEYYDANVNAYRKSAPLVNSYLEKIKSQQRKIESEKRRSLNKQLFSFDQKVNAYHQEEIELDEYVPLLINDVSKLPKNVQVFLDALELESELSFDVVESERNDLIAKLLEKLTKKESQEILNLSLAYRLGHLRHQSFYNELLTWTKKKGIALEAYSTFKSYVRYSILSDQIDVSSLYQQIGQLEKKQYSNLIKTKEEKDLVNQSKRLNSLAKLVNFSLTRDEWNDYKQSNDSLNSDVATFEDFYRFAEARDEAIVENTVNSMKRNNSQVSALVVGGFHTDGLVKRFLDKKITVLSYIPQLTKIESIEGPSYLSVFTQEKTPLEKLFDGEKLFTSPVPDQGANMGRIYVPARSAYLGRVNFKSGLSHFMPSFARLVDNAINISKSALQFSVSGKKKVSVRFDSEANIVGTEVDQEPVEVAKNVSDIWGQRFINASVNPAATPIISALHVGSLRALAETFYNSSLSPNQIEKQLVNRNPMAIRLLRIFGFSLMARYLNMFHTRRLLNFFNENLRFRLRDAEIGRANLTEKEEKLRSEFESRINRELPRTNMDVTTVRVEIFDESDLVFENGTSVLAPFVRVGDSGVFYIGRELLNSITDENAQRYRIGNTKTAIINTLIAREIMLQEDLNGGTGFDSSHQYVSSKNGRQRNLMHFADDVSRKVLSSRKPNLQVDSESAFSSEQTALGKSQREVEASLRERVMNSYEVLKRRNIRGSLQLTGDQDQSIVKTIQRKVIEWRKSGAEHVIFMGDDLDVSAQAILEKLTPINDWNKYFRTNGLPQVHLLNSTDVGSVKKIVEELSGTDRKKIRIVRMGSETSDWTSAYRTFSSQFGGDPLTETSGKIFTKSTIGLVMAGMVNPKLVADVYSGARRSHDEFLALSPNPDDADPDLFTRFEPLNWAKNVIRMGLTGQNVHVNMLFSSKLRLFSPWIAQKFNEALGAENINLFVTGEWATEFLHSTNQGLRQSRGLDNEQEEKGFIGVTSVETGESGDALIGRGAHPYYRTLRYSTLFLNFLISFGLTMFAARRPLNKVKVRVKTPEELGYFLHQVQVAAAMAGELASETRRVKEVETLGDPEPLNERLEEDNLLAGELNLEQNIFDVNSENKFGGVVGRAIGKEMMRGNNDMFNELIKIAKVTAGRLQSGVLKPFGSGSALDHLRSSRIVEDIDPSEKSAELFKNKKVIYAISIGGSTTGPIMAHALGLNEGPEIVEVPSIDGTRMQEIQEEIQNSKNPEEIGVVIISKSGVTIETDSNGWSVVESLEGALELKNEQDSSNLDVKDNVLIVTDPQLGSLRSRVEREGWLSLNHPILIGGRWSMFSSVGLFFYFVKGGSREELESAIAGMPQWDRKLQDMVKRLSELKKEWDSKDEDVKANALAKLFNILSEDQAVLAGFLDNVVNRLFKRDTEVALAWQQQLEQLISHKNPFYPQVRVESKSKPGVRFYTVAIWGWNAIRSLWGRIIKNKSNYVSLFRIQFKSESGPYHKLSTYQDRMADQAIKSLDRNQVPYLAVTTGPMNVATLLGLMRFQYLRLAADAALYRPMDVDSEGQPGVEQTKGIALAFLGKIGGTLKDLTQKYGEQMAQILRRQSLPIPEIPLDRIDEANEIPMDIPSAFNMSEDLSNLLTYLIRGDKDFPGLITQETQKVIDKTKSVHIHNLLKEIITKRIQNSSKVVSTLILDGETIPINKNGGYVVRASSLESKINLKTGTANGSNIGIYKHSENGELELQASLGVLWGSSTRVVVSDGTKTMDFVLKGDGNLIENDRAGEDNSIIMAARGNVLASGGISKERPKSFQRFERDIERKLPTSIRFSDALSADAYLMLNKQGRISGWITKGEAVELAQKFEAARGRAMVMTENGMVDISQLTVTKETLTSAERVFVFAGNQENIQTLQVYMDYLGAETDGEPPVLAILKALQSIPGTAPTALRANALLWVKRLKLGLSAIPKSDKFDPALIEQIRKIEEEIEKVLSALREQEAVAELTADYLRSNLQERRENSERYRLLGDLTVGLRFNPGISRGEETIHVYELEKEFLLVSPSELLSDIIHLSAGNVSSDELALPIQNNMAELAKEYHENSRTKTEEEVAFDLPDEDFKEPFADYLKYSAGIPPLVRQVLQLNSNRLPEQVQDALSKVVDIYLNDQVIDQADLEDPELIALREKEPSIFIQAKGELKIQSLHSIRTMLHENKYDPNVNLSGDISSRLDHIFNTILIHVLRSKVGVIISEEELDPIQGRKAIKIGNDQEAQVLLFLDPIDGSSQVKEAGTFGLITTVGVLLPDQKISDFDPRTQILGSFDIQFGWPRTVLSYVNRENQESKNSEVVQFELTEGVFKRVSSYEPITRLEEKITVWEGLLPKEMDSGYLLFAMGGSFLDSVPEDGHREVIADFIDTYGYSLGYTGALVNDIRKLLMADPRAMGILHTYGATGKHRNGRFRLAFELWHYALMFDALGGEAIDGLKPMLDNYLPDHEPSGQENEFYGGSRYLTKFILAWRNFVKQNLEGAEVTNEDFETFKSWYKQKTHDFLEGVYNRQKEAGVIFGTLDFELPKFRRALLNWDGDIYELITAPPEMAMQEFISFYLNGQVSRPNIETENDESTDPGAYWINNELFKNYLAAPSELSARVIAAILSILFLSGTYGFTVVPIAMTLTVYAPHVLRAFYIDRNESGNIISRLRVAPQDALKALVSFPVLFVAVLTWVSAYPLVMLESNAALAIALFGFSQASLFVVHLAIDNQNFGVWLSFLVQRILGRQTDKNLTSDINKVENVIQQGHKSGDSLDIILSAILKILPNAEELDNNLSQSVAGRNRVTPYNQDSLALLERIYFERNPRVRATLIAFFIENHNPQSNVNIGKKITLKISNFLGGNHTKVRSFHFGQIQNAEKLNEDLTSAVREIEQAKLDNSISKVTKNLVFILHPETPTEYQSQLAALVEANQDIAAITKYDEIPVEDGFRSYNTVLNLVAADLVGTGRLTAVQRLASKKYFRASFSVRTRVPGAFRATGWLRAIWHMTVNTPYGEKEYGPGYLNDLMDKAWDALLYA